MPKWQSHQAWGYCTFFYIVWFSGLLSQATLSVWEFKRAQEKRHANWLTFESLQMIFQPLDTPAPKAQEVAVVFWAEGTTYLEPFAHAWKAPLCAVLRAVIRALIANISSLKLASSYALNWNNDTMCDIGISIRESILETWGQWTHLIQHWGGQFRTVAQGFSNQVTGCLVNIKMRVLSQL